MNEVFFCNSGCEANEAAIKLARMYGHQKGVDLPAIIVMEHAFHGRTLATLSATATARYRRDSSRWYRVLFVCHSTTFRPLNMLRPIIPMSWRC